MSVHEYRDDDEGYRDWMEKHRDGYVINIQRSHNPSDARLHDAECWTLTDHFELDVSLTGPYAKICGTNLDEVKAWAADNVGESIEPCGTCRNPGAGGGNGGINRRETGRCLECNQELPLTGKCHYCDED
jgi:hypothetical protein